MRNKLNTKKILALLCAMMLILAMISSCGPQETPSTSTDRSTDISSPDDVLDELPLPLTETKKELTVWTLYVNTFVPDPNDLPGVQKMEEITNVRINWITVGLMELQEKFTQLMVSRDLPDIIYITGMEFPGGIQKAVDDGFLIEVTDLVAKYMPNYRGILYSDDRYVKEIITDDGKYNYVSGFTADINGEPVDQRPFIGLTARKDLLDEHGLELPETIDEWYDTLTFFRDQGMTMPLKVAGLGAPAGGGFISAYGMLLNFYMDGNEIKHPALEPEFRDWLEMMAKWYDEGLIDPNFMALGEGAYMPDAAAIASDNTLAFSTLFTFTYDGLYKTGFTNNPDCELVPVRNPVLNKGDRPKGALGLDTAVGHPIFITSGCKDTELAAMWIDYQFTLDGMLTNFLGVEGETYVIDNDGTVSFTDLVRDNPDGRRPTDVLARYARGNGLGLFFDRLDQKLDPDSRKFEAIDIWADQINIEPPARAVMTSEESFAYNEMMVAVETEFQERTVKFITGQESFDNYDRFVQTLIDFGLEECIAYRQAAIDRYLERG